MLDYIIKNLVSFNVMLMIKLLKLPSSKALATLSAVVVGKSIFNVLPDRNVTIRFINIDVNFTDFSSGFLGKLSSFNSLALRSIVSFLNTN